MRRIYCDLKTASNFCLVGYEKFVFTARTYFAFSSFTLELKINLTRTDGKFNEQGSDIFKKGKLTASVNK